MTLSLRKISISVRILILLTSFLNSPFSTFFLSIIGKNKLCGNM